MLKTLQWQKFKLIFVLCLLLCVKVWQLIQEYLLITLCILCPLIPFLPLPGAPLFTLVFTAPIFNHFPSSCSGAASGTHRADGQLSGVPEEDEPS